MKNIRAYTENASTGKPRLKNIVNLLKIFIYYIFIFSLFILITILVKRNS